MYKNPVCLLSSGSRMRWRPAAAQDIYRCGDSYSQQPCAGGTLVAGRGCAQRRPAVADQPGGPARCEDGRCDGKGQAEGRGQAASRPIFRAKAQAARPRTPEAGCGRQGEEARVLHRGRARQARRRHEEEDRRSKADRIRQVRSRHDSRAAALPRLRRQPLVLLPQRFAALDVRRVDGDARHRADLHALRLVEVAHAFGALVRVDLVDLRAPGRWPGSGTRARTHRS